ncbi:MAG: sel1 repeat family protein [Acidobacteria bacterium]|nr:sel1 repeat family protein [Acidobacteriota bacterium]
MTRRNLIAVWLAVSLSGAVLLASGYEAGLAAFAKGDHATALKEWRAAAEKGDANAQVSLGNMFFSGQGVTRDHGEALKWYRMAAEQGNPSAEVYLGNMSFSGMEVPKDYAEAVKWYRMAAEKGFAPGQVNLGLMYSYGLGVPQDYVEAHVWFNLAGIQGDPSAILQREQLAEKMTPSQIAEAQTRAKGWKPNKPAAKEADAKSGERTTP